MKNKIFLVLLFFVAFSYTQPVDWLRKIYSFDWLYSNAQQSARLSPGLGNGYIGTTAFSDSLFIAGVYNGKVSGLRESSHRARIPSTLNIQLQSIDEMPADPLDCAHDLETGRYIERINGKVERTMYVHREHKHLLVHELKSLSGIHEVCLKSNPGNPSSDINFTRAATAKDNYGVYSGWTQITEWTTNPKLFVVVITWEPKKTATKTGEIASWTQCFTLDIAKDPLVFYTILADDLTVEEATKEYEKYNQMKPADMMSSHISNWMNLRKELTSINIYGYAELARATNASVYELLISMREDVFWSSSPGGLTTNSYNGHVFWDYETWMYPVLLVMRPIFAKNGLQYRLNHIEGAYKKAVESKYKGAMWPWESSYSGDEVTPKFAMTGLMEHHISGDIVFAARQYDYLHRNSAVRESLLCPLALETAEYWTSRVEKDKNGHYHIKHIIPPDEYAENVDDNIYTNDVAKIALLYANECRANATWTQIANNMYVEYDAKNDYHPEFTGYKIGRQIKQADVILISFPLGQNYTTSSLLNDLLIYEKVTSSNGPAMTWSMHFINYVELARTEEEIVQATHKYLYRSFLLNVKGPFYVWWETPTEGAIHFATGAGGFLQALIFGYAGLRIHYDPKRPEILARFKPVTPIELVERIEVCDINLLEGNVKIDVRVEAENTFIRTRNLGLYLHSEVKGKFVLTPNEWIKVPSNIGLEDKNGFYLVAAKGTRVMRD